MVRLNSPNRPWSCYIKRKARKIMMENTEITMDLVIYTAAIITITASTVSVIAIKLYAYLTMGICTCNTTLEGKTVLITGANGGIGKETAKDMAKRGARVILACRNVHLGESVKDEIIKQTGNNNIICMKLDLSSLKSIREFAEKVNETEKALHILIHNAGTAETVETITEDGLELTMATNHFGPFLLTHLLIDLLKRSGSSRIVIVASSLYRLALTFSLKKLNPKNSFIPALNYYSSKYANILFCQELSRRLKGTNVTANCLHPGLIDSGIWRNVPFPLSWGMQITISAFFKSPEQGAQTTIHLAVAKELENVSGKYFSDCKESVLSRNVKDMDTAKKLWELSEDFVQLRTEDPKI